jgi:hypothetical protein
LYLIRFSYDKFNANHKLKPRVWCLGSTKPLMLHVYISNLKVQMIDPNL